MPNKREMEAEAKALINTAPNDAVVRYREIWETFSDQFNAWDAFFTIKAMRAATSSNLDWAKELTIKYKDEKVSNLYGWLIFDKCVKGKERSDILQNENIIAELTGLSPQKDVSVNDSFPCPTTISVLKLCDLHSENLFNARKINDLLENLNYTFLSKKSKTLKTEEKGDIELASDYEKYFALKTKSLLKLGEFEKCRDLCTVALSTIEKFHYNNDTWFKMRIALSQEKLGNHELSEELLKELLSSRAGNDKWFLYRDIAEVFFEQGDFSAAWKYAVDAAFYGNEPHFLIGLYLLQARILFKLERPDEGKILAELIHAILREQQWNDKLEYIKLFEYYKIDRSSLRSVNDIIIEARKFWTSERYGNKKKLSGSVISIHRNGKIGRIKEEGGSIIDFHKKDLVKKMRSIESIQGATVEFFAMESFEGKLIAENIVIIEQQTNQIPGDLVGKVIDGVVKNVTEFGVFIRLQGVPDGLLHKNNLPNDLKSKFKDVFTKGKEVKVKIEKVTEKGVQLKLVGKV